MANLRRSHIEIRSDGYCCKHIGEIIVADKMCFYVVSGVISLLTGVVPLEAEHRFTADSVSFNGKPSLIATSVRRKRKVVRDALKILVVVVDEDGAWMRCDEAVMPGVGCGSTWLRDVGTHKVVKFALCADDALERSESLQVGASHVGDNGIIRLYNVNESLDVAGVRSSHLHYGNVVLGTQTQQCLGHADVVIEVALCEEHVVFLAENSRSKFLCGGLSVGSCNANHWCAELTAVVTGEEL